MCDANRVDPLYGLQSSDRPFEVLLDVFRGKRSSASLVSVQLPLLFRRLEIRESGIENGCGDSAG
jgi:hypothetical protein